MLYPLVTLCGSYNLSQSWIKPCINSWDRLLNIDANHRYLIPDTHLNKPDEDELSSKGFKVCNNTETEEEIENYLSSYPYLSKIRKNVIYWRKLLDPTILFNKFEQVVLIDSDVHINHDCTLPEGEIDYAYMRDDMPAYGANWRIVYNKKMVPALNAGFVIYRPKKVDFDFLEYITKKYLIEAKDQGWTEQVAWACLAGRAKNRYLFDGEQVRLTSSSFKRTPQQVKENRYTYFGKKGTIREFDTFRPYIEGSSIIHFAGFAKVWIEESIVYLDSVDFSTYPKEIKIINEDTLSLQDKLLLSSRLMYKGLAVKEPV